MTVQSRQLGAHLPAVAPVKNREKNINMIKENTQKIFNVEESDDEDEEVATLTGTDRNKSSASKMLTTPFAASKTLATQGVYMNNRNHLISAPNAALDANKHRRTPGAPLMRNSAFITPHKIFPGAGEVGSAMKSQAHQVQNKQNQGDADSQGHIRQKGDRPLGSAVNNAGAAMEFGLVCSPVTGVGRPPPSASKGKSSVSKGKGKLQLVPAATPDYRGIGLLNAAENGTGGVRLVGRKAVYTPTDVALAKNSDIFLRRTGTGAYSPYTEQLISGIDGVLTDDDTSTPQSVTSVGSQQDAHTTHRRASSKENASVLSRNETWHSNFTETSDQHQFQNIRRKAGDVSSINSIGSAASGSSKAEGLLHFNMTPQVGSCFQPPKGATHFSPTRLKQHYLPVQHVDLNIGASAKNKVNERSSSDNSDPRDVNQHVYQQNAVPPEYVDSSANNQGKGQCAYQYTGQYQNQSSFDHHHVPQQGYANRPLTETNFQHQNLQRGGIDNPQMNFHQPIAGHISPHIFGHLSPLNVPPHCPSPQTIPSYEYPMAPVQVAYPSVSPTPFDHLAWHGPDVHRNQNHNWGSSGDVVRWNQHQQHQSMPLPGFMDGRHIIPSPPPYPSPLHHPHHQHGQMNWENREYHHFDTGSMAPNRHEAALFHHSTIDINEAMNSGVGQQHFGGNEQAYNQLNLLGPRKSGHRAFTLETLKKSQRDTLPARERKTAKQQKQKVLSDSSTKRMNKNNQDQVNPDPTTKSRGGKKYSRKTSADETAEVKELTREEQEAEERRAELVESPAIRNLLKEFYRKFRAKEKESLEVAADFAKSCLSQSEFPKSVHWRIILEMADLKKRSNLFDEARELYSDVCRLQPYTNQGWLERSKLEEESGRLSACSSILHEGLKYCPINESLRTRAIKHEERMAYEHGDGNLSRARYLLAPLKHFSIEKVWKTVLEGALMEARAGNEIEARQILKYLMKWVSWYGPLYLEAFRLERDYGHVENALKVVDDGLKEIPRYGPLWFGAFRICEGMDIENGDLHLPRTFEYINRAIKSISRELIWKVQMEAAQALERAAHKAKNEDPSISLNGMLTESRSRFVKTISSCPENLCWKVWLAAGRMELSAGRFEEARRLFLKSHSVVPAKGRPSVLLECVRLEEFIGNTKLAKAILCKTRTEAKADWKVWLQSVSMEVRSGNRKLAINLAQRGLLQHSGTGRLWATLVQLREQDGEEQQMKALKKALYAVPKSGEVWCEAARIYLNPFSPCFDLCISSRYLEFATKFTPQYGDSFVEKLREEMISALIQRFAPAYVEKGISILQDCPVEELTDKVIQIIQKAAVDFDNNASITKGIDEVVGNLDISKLELRCSNADPNYGKLWFYSRSKPSDTARKVLEQAKEVIWNDLRHCGFIYIVATIRQQAVKYCQKANKETSVPSLTVLLSANWQDINLLEGISKTNFVTGFIEANREVELQSLSLFDRRKILFGSDLLLI